MRKKISIIFIILILLMLIFSIKPQAATKFFDVENNKEVVDKYYKGKLSVPLKENYLAIDLYVGQEFQIKLHDSIKNTNGLVSKNEGKYEVMFNEESNNVYMKISAKEKSLQYRELKFEYDGMKITIDVKIEARNNGKGEEYSEDIDSLVDAINKDKFKIDIDIEPQTENIIETILNYIIFFGIVISTICLAILGFRYIMGSASDKSDYKQTLVTFAIGAAILISGTSIVRFILEITLDW